MVQEYFNNTMQAMTERAIDVINSMDIENPEEASRKIQNVLQISRDVRDHGLDGIFNVEIFSDVDGHISLQRDLLLIAASLHPEVVKHLLERALVDAVRHAVAAVLQLLLGQLSQASHVHVPDEPEDVDAAVEEEKHRAEDDEVESVAQPI